MPEIETSTKKVLGRLLALVDQGHDAFGVIVPDCPGCNAMGSPLELAFSNATEALSEWMIDRRAHGLQPPVARSLKDLRSDPRLAEDFAAGSIVVSIPLRVDTGRSVRANISRDAGLLSAIDDAAKLRGLTRSSFLASAARSTIATGR